MPPRVLVIGLDCAPPALVFDRFRAAMPCVSALMDRGVWGPLRSTIPPITIPAWTTMTTGRDPGELGLYGFRHRLRGSYDLQSVDAHDITTPRVWNVLGDAGKRVSVCFVPPTWPPQPVRGELVSCFMTPVADRDRQWTWPQSLGRELEDRFGPYVPDGIENVGTIREATLQHFAIARHLWDTRRPDFLMMVDIEPDRFHHAYWREMGADGAMEATARDYYALLDREVSTLVDRCTSDTTILIASDHGARDMVGGVRVNEWLIANGWLSLTDRAHCRTRIEPRFVDWSRTRAWGEGGYYARIFLNVRGREPEGIVDPADYESERTRLADAFAAMTGPDGRSLGNVVLRPEDSYRETRGLPPDLCVFFGDLAYRSLGSLADGEVFSSFDDVRGAHDGCNHDWNGIFVAAGAGFAARGRTEGMSIEDVAPTILARFGVARPDGMHGRDLAEPPA